jgi:hypothetical protein
MSQKYMITVYNSKSMFTDVIFKNKWNGNSFKELMKFLSDRFDTTLYVKYDQTEITDEFTIIVLNIFDMTSKAHVVEVKKI